MLPPFFPKACLTRVIDSYRYVIDGGCEDLPMLKLYLYHIPQVTGVGLSHHRANAAIPSTPSGHHDSACTTAHSSARLSLHERPDGVSALTCQKWAVA
jgi:4-hydroxy-tetrahydrodipicolinate synthase